MKRPILAAVIGAVLYVLASPLFFVHCCNAGSKTFEFGMTAFFALVTFIFIWRLPNRNARILTAAISPVFSYIVVSSIYFSWIHGPKSPWPENQFFKSAGPLTKIEKEGNRTMPSGETQGP